MKGVVVFFIFLIALVIRINEKYFFNQELFNQATKQSKTIEFNNHLTGDIEQYFKWPAFESLQTNLIFLELLNGLTDKQSYSKDYSWFFVKLYKLLSLVPKDEENYTKALLPLFFVISKDKVGTTHVMNKLIDKFYHVYDSWFWSGFHASDNLFDFQIGGDMYLKAATFPNSLKFLSQLGARMKLKGRGFLNKAEKELILKNNLTAYQFKLINETRPEFFQ